MRIQSLITGFVIAVFFVSGFIGFTGCAHKPKGPEAPATVMANEMDGAPVWVIKGCATYLKGTKDNKNICGVGSMGGTRNPSLARTAAEGRARTELARSLQAMVMAMLKDYQATTTGGQEFGTAAADEQHVVDVSKQITDMTLSGTELIDSWISKNGTYYALVVMNVDKFKDSISKMKNLSESVRQAVIERADKAFGELDQEIDKERAE